MGYIRIVRRRFIITIINNINININIVVIIITIILIIIIMMILKMIIMVTGIRVISSNQICPKNNDHDNPN